MKEWFFRAASRVFAGTRCPASPGGDYSSELDRRYPRRLSEAEIKEELRAMDANNAIRDAMILRPDPEPETREPLYRGDLTERPKALPAPEPTPEPASTPALPSPDETPVSTTTPEKKYLW